MAISVNLRKKKISKNRYSFYLDIAPPIEKNGKLVRKEYLKIHIPVSPRKPFEVHDRDNRSKQATQMRDKRYDELNGTAVQKEMKAEEERLFLLRKGNYLSFLNTQMEQSKPPTKSFLSSLIRHLEIYLKTELKIDELKISDLNETFAKGFINYMDSPDRKTIWGGKLASTTRGAINNAFATSLKTLFNEGLKTSLIKLSVSRGEPKDGIPLTIEELNHAYKLYLESPDEIKRACLFTATTSLRISDVKELKWGMIKNGQLRKILKKTKKPYDCPLSQSAIMLLGERGDDDENVFEQIPLNYNQYMRPWIRKFTTEHITHHDFRYTFQTLLYEAGVRDGVVRQFMHPKSNRTSTELYTKHSIETLKEAVNKIKLNK